MEQNKKSIFRKQSFDRISTPEELDHYLIVTGPGIWLTLIAIVILLIGVIFWAIFARLDTRVNVAVVSDGTQVICYLPDGALEELSGDEIVTVAGKDYPLTDTGRARMLIDADTDPDVLIAGTLYEGMLVRPLEVDAALSAGVYEGEIVVEAIRPISLIIN